MYTVRTSVLPAWNDCPARGAAKYYRYLVESKGFILNDIPPKQIYASVGKGFHSGAGYLDSQKQRLETINLDSAIEFGIVDFRNDITDGVEWDDVTANINTAEKQIIRMTQQYHADIFPTVIEPIHIEHEYKRNLNDECELTGHPDLVCKGAIRDKKTGRRENSYIIQLGGYDLLDGKNDKRLIVDYVPRVSVKKPQPASLSITFDSVIARRSAYIEALRILAQIKKFDQTGNMNVFSRNLKSNLCSAKFCPAFGTEFCELTM